MTDSRIDWYVSDSDTEEKETVSVLSKNPKPDCVISFALERLFGGGVDSMKMIELLRKISSERCLELDCANGYFEERRHKRKKRKRRNRDSFPDGEISETTSERISTHTASTGECRDNRRPSLSAFDYEHEEFPALRGAVILPRKKTKPSSRYRKDDSKTLLATIEAQIRNEEELHSDTCDSNAEDNVDRGGASPEIASLPSIKSSGADATPTSGMGSSSFVNGGGADHPLSSNGHANDNLVFNFSFDDDEDGNTSYDQDTSIFSKIRNIESFLDQDN